jgi:hypothetical protein
MLPPLIYTYRHALELVLKQAIRKAAPCLRLAGNDDPKLVPEALETYLKRKQGHRLGPLSKQLTVMLKELDIEELPADVVLTLERLHLLDPTGEAFRYADQLKTDSHHVHVGPLVELFRDAFNVTHGGVLAVLDQYADYQYEMWQAQHGDAESTA